MCGSEMNLMHHSIFAFAIFYVKLAVTRAACRHGWFGVDCQYLCHYEPGTACDVSSVFPPKCEPDWFGHNCQYRNMMQDHGVTVSISSKQTSLDWLTDSTCSGHHGSLEKLTISWKTTIPITWLRFQVDDTSAVLKLNITFSNNGHPVKTSNPLITVLVKRTVDYRFVLNETIDTINIAGDGVKSLCSIYVSGGRNVALRQMTTQSSYFTPSKGGDLAVDGITDNNYFGDGCTHTALSDVSPSWTLIWGSPKSIQRIVVYNRGDCCSGRLKNFKLEAFDAHNKTVLTYIDSSETKLVYTVSIVGKNNIFEIRISPTSKEIFDKNLVLSLCEVEVYGECGGGMWGYDCRETCPQDCSTWCHQDTGQCPSCFGFSDPPECNNACTKGYYGLNCKNKCRDECYVNSCDRFTGDCDRGCSGYSNPPDCNIKCLSGWWGHNCRHECGEECHDNSCDARNGACDKGCVGSSNPPYCNEECLFGRWGHNCKSNCSDGCYNKSCDRVTGICEIGCYGYTHPPECNIECDFDRWGIDCQEECGENCYNRSCNSKTGVCDKGCNGYINPPECNLVAEVKDGTFPITIEAYVAISVAVAVAIVMCIVAFVYCKARGRRPRVVYTKQSKDNTEDMLQFYDSGEQDDNENLNITQVSSTGNVEDNSAMDKEIR